MLYDLLLPNFGILSYRILGFHIVPPSSRFIFLLGLVSYAGMMISVIRNFLHAGKKSMLVGACGFCVLAYTVNNMFSFQQVMNISTVFVIMGIGENLRRSARD